MKKYLLILGVVVIALVLALSGCQEQATTVENTFENIFFESDILEITNASYDASINKGIIQKVDVTVNFRNKLDKPINNLRLSIDFCDENDNVIHSHPYTYGTPFPAGYSEASPNRFSYDEDNVVLVDHVNIRITNYEIGD